MPRSHARRREWRKLRRIMEEADARIDRQISVNERYPDVCGIYKNDPTAREALENLAKTKTAIR